MLKLGLIGQSIAKSRSPALHKMIGELYGLEVGYELHEPRDATPEAFSETLSRLRAEGYRGCNVTFPYKQIAVGHARHVDQAVRRIGSTNTLSFRDDEVYAANTDYTGFIRGYRSQVGVRPGLAGPGRVLLLGAGGVGRAVAFGLFELGATEVDIFDLNRPGADALAQSLNSQGFKAAVVSAERMADAAANADGLVNCTPVGHYKTPGNPIALGLIGGQSWAFDAVYTPIDTEFMMACHEKGLATVSGFDLFFYQGIDAFEIFAEMTVDPAEVLGPFMRRFDIRSALIG